MHLCRLWRCKIRGRPTCIRLGWRQNGVARKGAARPEASNGRPATSGNERDLQCRGVHAFKECAGQTRALSKLATRQQSGGGAARAKIDYRLAAARLRCVARPIARPPRPAGRPAKSKTLAREAPAGPNRLRCSP